MTRVAATDRTSKDAPIFSSSRLGHVAFLGAESNNADVAIEANGRIVGVGVVGGQARLFIYDSGLWTRADISGAVDVVNMMFADSNGNVFFSIESDAQLFRLADGATTPTAVLTTGTTPALTAGNEIASMCEDGSGNLYCTEYPTAKAMYKSTDAGLTWTKIVDGSTGFPGSGLVPANHIHNVSYDPIRGLLFSACGDNSSMYNQVSADEGVTWSSWTATTQTTAFAFDNDYIYYTADLAGDRKIYRSTGATLAEVIASTPTAVFSPIAELPLPGTVGTDEGAAGHCWNAGIDNGIVWFAYGAVSTTGYPAYLIASSDQFNTWRAFRTPGVDTGANADFSHIFQKTESGSTPWRYGKLTGLNGIVAWRLTKAGDKLIIDPTNGVDPWEGDGLTWDEFADGLLHWSIPIKLAESITDARSVGQPFIHVDYDGNTYASTVVSPHHTNDCEAAFGTGWSKSESTTGVAMALDPVVYAEGSNSLKSVLGGGGTEYSIIQNTTAFSTLDATFPNVWMSFQHLISSAITAQVILGKIHRSGDYIQIEITSDNYWQLRIDNNVTGVDLQYKSDRLATVGKWQTIKLHVTRANTNGRAQLYVDGELIIDVTGLDTIGTNSMSYAAVGVTSSQAITYNFDNIKLSYGDPDEPTGLNLSGRYQTSEA